MRTLWLIFFGLCSTGFVNGFTPIGVNDWEDFKTQFGKVYESSSEEVRRMKIWMENKAEVERHNEEFDRGKVSYRQAVNNFADMTAIEVEERYLGLKVSQPNEAYEERIFIKLTNPVPDTVDWRDKGAVSNVKDQGQCGSCYAFSAVGAIEGQYFLKTGNLLSFSEQQVLDCSKKFKNLGCDGGFMRSVYKYVQANNGLDTEEAYPYKAEETECHFIDDSTEATLKGFDLFEESEEALKNAVATIGPISVGIVVTPKFSLYDRGVFYELYCNHTMNHGVLVVGYGNDDGEDYWLVKNSWGPKWGEHGYIKMARNRNNMCLIASDATVPTNVGTRSVKKLFEVAAKKPVEVAAKKPVKVAVRSEAEVEPKNEVLSGNFFMRFIRRKFGKEVD
jgi:cathepsin L